MRLSRFESCFLVCLSLLVPMVSTHAAPQADRTAPTASPEDAVALPSGMVQVEIKVRSSKLRTDRDEVDLNSHTSFRDPANLAVVVPGPVSAWYSYQGIHDLPKFFFGKSIRVVGVVEEFAGQRRILVTDPAQIQVLN